MGMLGAPKCAEFHLVREESDFPELTHRGSGCSAHEDALSVVGAGPLPGTADQEHDVFVPGRSCSALGQAI